ncbi:MAG: ankyrin repeat domain-containing protein [Pseudomonadota bacterium]
MRARLMTIGIIFCVFFIFSTFFMPSFDPGDNKTIIVTMTLVRIIGSIVLAVLSYRYAASIGRSAIKWALGSLLFPFVVPLILCFLPRPYGPVAVSERAAASPVYEEPPSKYMEILEPPLPPVETFLSSKDKTTYKNALKQINDQDVLRELLESVQEREKIVLVLRKIKNQSIIEKFAQEHPDNGIRITAIGQLRNQDLLARIALHDKTTGARMAAVKHIADAGILAEIVRNDPHPGIKEAAAKALENKQNHQKNIEASTDAQTPGKVVPIEGPLETSSKPKNMKNAKLTQKAIQNLIIEKRLRPLGNRQRLTHTDNDYNVRLFLFAEKSDAETYYEVFIQYAEKKSPPFPIEIMLTRIHTIYDEPFGLIFPYERTDTRPEYVAWFRDANLTCNEKLRNFQPADHQYEMLNQYVKELYHWTILVPELFDLNLEQSKQIFSDPPGEGFTPLKMNSQPDEKSTHQLIQASEKGNIDLLRELLNTGVDVNARSEEGATALILAAFAGHGDICRLLIDQEIDINATDKNGFTALMTACEAQVADKDLVALLIEKGADVNAASAGGSTALLSAAKTGNGEIVELLLSTSADINARNQHFVTPLIWAADQGHSQIVELLVAKGADIHARTDNGYTALAIAQENGHYSIVQVLKNAG